MNLGGFNPAGGGGGCAGPHCSSDLHSLVDCEGNVISTCPPDQGCTTTGCVDACDSATANKSNIGCEYYAVVPDVIFGGTGACYAAYVANTWTTPVTLQLDFGGMPLDPSKFAFIPSGTGQSIKYTPIVNGQIPAGQVAILFLNTLPGLPLPGLKPRPARRASRAAFTNMDAATHGTGIGKSFHFTASAPVVAYDIYPYGGGQSAMTSATLLLPTSAWDTNYIAVDAFGSNPVSPPFVQFVASQDNTNVTIKPVAAIAGGTGVAAAAVGVPQTYALSHGQVLQITQAASLGGSVVQSDKPIGAWGGSTALSIEACCDETAHQQIHAGPGPRQRVRPGALPEPLRQPRRVASLAARRRGRRHQAHLGAGGAPGRAADARARAGCPVRRATARTWCGDRTGSTPSTCPRT